MCLIPGDRLMCYLEMEGLLYNYGLLFLVCTHLINSYMYNVLVLQCPQCPIEQQCQTSYIFISSFILALFSCDLYLPISLLSYTSHICTSICILAHIIYVQCKNVFVL